MKPKIMINSSNLQIMPLAESINLALRDHQSGAMGWDFGRAATDLHGWAERFIFEFKLEIGVPALMIEPLKRGYGHFRRGRNGFGLIDEVGIDETHVRTSPYWRVCGTLFHELLHSWQEHHGRPGAGNYHNKQFRNTALSFGLKIDQRGYTEYVEGATLFFSLLKKYGLSTPDIPKLNPVFAQARGSKLKLYECGCGVKVRVGRSRFNARCLDCGGIFVLKEPFSIHPKGPHMTATERSCSKA